MIIVGDVPVGKSHFGKSLFDKKGFAFYEKVIGIAHDNDCKVCAQLHQSDSNIKAMLKYVPGVLTKRISMQELRPLLNNEVAPYITNMPHKKVKEITSAFGTAAVLAKKAGGVNALALCCAGICGTEPPAAVCSGQVCSSKNVSDHHAVVPTMAAGETDLEALPAGEREILRLISRQVLMAVSAPFVYLETEARLDCGGNAFSAKGKTLIQLGWKVYADAELTDKPLPELSEGQLLPVSSCAVKEGRTTPPKHFTEDTLLSAMETAGKEDMPEDAERKGLGTPATRAAVIEKLVATGFAERRKAKKSVRLVPTEAGVSLITVLPEQLQSPLLTAEWEHRLKEIECGELGADEFLAGIRDMVAALVRDAAPVDGAEVLFPSGRPVVGKCPRCGAEVTESKNGYFCERRSCKFGLWRDNRFLAAKKISLTKKMASSLLTQGRAYASGIYSEKTGKTYDAFIVLEDDGARSSYKLDFTK